MLVRNERVNFSSNLLFVAVDDSLSPPANESGYVIRFPEYIRIEYSTSWECLVAEQSFYRRCYGDCFNKEEMNVGISFCPKAAFLFPDACRVYEGRYRCSTPDRFVGQKIYLFSPGIRNGTCRLTLLNFKSIPVSACSKDSWNRASHVPVSQLKSNKIWWMHKENLHYLMSQS